MDQATLRTARLTLVPLADEHLDGELELDGDPAVMRYLDSGAHTRETVSAEHRERLGAAGDGFGYWAGMYDGRFAALMSLVAPHREDQTGTEIGWRVVSRFWRQGLAKEAAGELVNHGFTALGVERIFAETMFVNAASRATMTAIGMSYVRTFHKHFDDPLPGTEHGEVEYALTHEQWRAAR